MPKSRRNQVLVLRLVLGLDKSKSIAKTTRFSTLKVPTVTWEIPETIFGPDPRAGETDWYTFFYLGFSPADAIAQKTQVGCLCLSEKG